MKPILYLLFCLTLTASLAQRPAGKATLTGVVVDSVTSAPLRLASVSLLTARDSGYVMTSVTDGEGRFLLRNIAEGQYRLLITFVGYQNGTYPATIARGTPVDMGTLRLTEQSRTLNEVVIKQERPPISVKGDTVEFNASSFKTPPHAQVEDLLKKLPGIDVSRDGAIRAQGQAVNRVLVNGKPFFGNDPKMATRNLPAGIIDKVQLYDQSSDQSQFSGIDDGNRERTINLTIRPDQSRGYFGQNALGIGTRGDDAAQRYQARLNLNRFTDRNGKRPQQLSLIGQANNLNQQNFTLPEAQGPGGGSGQPIFVGNGGGGLGGNQTPTSIIATQAGGVNYRTDRLFSKGIRRLDVVGSYFVSQVTTTIDQQIRRESSLASPASDGGAYSRFLTSQRNANQNRQLTHRFNARLDWQIDTLTTLRLTPNLTWQNSDYTSRLSSQSTRPVLGSPNAEQLLNTGLTQFSSTSQGLNGTNNLLLMRKFRREGRTLSMNLYSVLTSGLTTALNQSTNRFYDSTGVTLPSRQFDQQSRQAGYSRQHTLTLSFTEPLSLTQKLELRYAFSTIRNRADRDVADKDPESGLYTRPNGALSNEFGSLFQTQQVGGTLQTRRLRYTYGLGLDLQQASLQADNYTADTSRSRVYWNLLPNALFTYTFSGNRSLRLQYRTRLSPPSLTQLQPTVDNTNPLNIRLGNPALRPEYYNTLTLTYNAATGMGTRNLFLFASLNQSDNRIGTATTISSAGAQTTQPVNLGGYWTVNSFVSVGRTFPSKLGLTLTTNGSVGRSLGLMNNQPNASRTMIFGQGVRLQTNNDNGRIDVGISGTTNYQTVSYALLPQQNTAFWTHYATADLHWQLPLGLVLTSDLTYTSTTGRAPGFNQPFTLWNMALAKQFMKTKQAEFRFQVFDLLNQNRSLTRNATEAYVEDINSVVLRRYFLLSFVYNLRKFGV